MKYLLIFLFPLAAFSQTKIYVDPGTNIKMAITEYNDVPIIKIKPGQNTKFILKKDINFAPNAILVDVPRDSTVHYEVRMEVIIVPETTQPPKPDLVFNIDGATTEARNKYTGSWQHGVKSNTLPSWLDAFHNATASYTLTSGAFLETTFDGYKVEWYTEKAKNHGKAGVSIDGGAVVEVDLYDATTINNSKLVWTSPDLDKTKPHTIKISYTGNKNQLATEATIIHDYFKVYKAQ